MLSGYAKRMGRSMEAVKGRGRVLCERSQYIQRQTVRAVKEEKCRNPPPALHSAYSSTYIARKNPFVEGFPDAFSMRHRR